MKNLIILPFLILSILATAQINVGSKYVIKLNPGGLSESKLHMLRNSKTLFIYRDVDNKQLKKLKSVLGAVWTYTEIEFCSYDEFISNSSKYTGYSFFTISNYYGSTSNGASKSNVYLTLNMEIKGKIKYFSRIDLDMTGKSHSNARTIYKEDRTSYLYKEAEINNWSIGYLKNYLQFINNKLINNEIYWVFTSKTYKNLSNLKSDVLYIPEYIFENSDISTESEEKKEIMKLMKKYPYNYKIISKEELSSLIVESEKSIYYLLYISSSSDKFVSVTNGFSGNLLYTNYTGASLNFKSKDITRIANKVE